MEGDRSTAPTPMGHETSPDGWHHLVKIGRQLERSKVESSSGWPWSNRIAGWTRKKGASLPRTRPFSSL